MAVKTGTPQAIINGQTYNLTYNSTTKEWEAQITAPGTSSFNLSGGYFPVTLKAEDVAGNRSQIDATHATQGKDLQLTVKEKIAPVVTITAPAAGASITNNKPVITFKVTDDDSGVNADTVKLIIDNGSAITGSALTKKAISGGYEFSYTPVTALSDGSHTIKVDASDNDGNAATQKTCIFKVDTVPPTLSVDAPVDNLETNQRTITVSGKTNDETSSPVTLKVNGTNTPVSADGKFSTQITLEEGKNEIAFSATDGAGKTTTVKRTVILDTKAPVFSNIKITPNPVDAGKTFVISVTITD